MKLTILILALASAAAAQSKSPVSNVLRDMLGVLVMKEIDRRLKVSDLIIRHLIVRIDEEQTVIDRTRAERTEASRRRRLARGLAPRGGVYRAASEIERRPSFRASLPRTRIAKVLLKPSGGIMTRPVAW